MKKESKITVIAISVVIVCVIGIVAALGIKARNGNKPEQSTAPLSSTSEPVTEEDIIPSETEPSDLTTNEVSTTKADKKTASEAITELQEKITEAIEKTTGAVKEDKTTTEKTTEAITVPELNPDEMSKGQASKSSVAPSSDVKNLPNDMSLYGLTQKGYNVVGLKQYIYNNDMSPNCTQRKFGYNSLYDSGAKLIDFSIDTVKFKFNFEGKTYRIQLWKGQYISGEIGTVGGEVGIYTKDGENYTGDHFNCAGTDDELFMEMTIFWDEFNDGVYLPQLTRNYGRHWWETGYVDGQMRNRKNSKELRLLSHMTMRSEEQAIAFANALANRGFTEVETFNPNSKDTFKRHGKDIILIWQDAR